MGEREGVCQVSLTVETRHREGERSAEEGWFTGRWGTADANTEKEARRSCGKRLPEYQLAPVSTALYAALGTSGRVCLCLLF